MSDRDAVVRSSRTLMLEDIAAHPRLARRVSIRAATSRPSSRASAIRRSGIRSSQIAWDGSQKLPFRLLGTIGDPLAAGAPIDRLCVPIAAWMHFLRQRAQQRIPIVDPLAERLAAIGRECSGETSDVPRFLDLHNVFPQALAVNPRFRSTLRDAYGRLSVPPEQIPTRVRESLAGPLVAAG